MPKMQITEEQFAEWRESFATQYIFDTLLPKHIVTIQEAYKHAAWAGHASEALWLSAKAEEKIINQLLDMNFEDFRHIAEDGRPPTLQIEE